MQRNRSLRQQPSARYDLTDTLKQALNKIDLTRMETGKYKMNYNVPSDAALGMWKILV